MLPRIQFAGADGLDFSVCYPQPEFNRRTILWDLNYFKYCFLKATGLEFQEDKLEDEFEHMAEILMRSASATFLYRDFQSRSRADVKARSITMWLLSCGRPKPTCQTLSGWNWYRITSTPCVNTSR